MPRLIEALTGHKVVGASAGDGHTVVSSSRKNKLTKPINSSRPSSSIFLVISFFFWFFVGRNGKKKRFGDPDR